MNNTYETTDWGGLPFEEYERWEQREILSRSETTKLHNTRLIADITKNFLQGNTKFSWTKGDLTIEDEAAIQKMLRIKGVELYNAQLYSFPTSIEQLQKHTYKPIVKTPPTKLEIYWDLVKAKGYVDAAFTIAAITGLIAFHSNLFWYSLIVGYFTCNLSTIVNHECWAHKYIIPKNKFIGYLLDLFASACWFHYTDKRSLAYVKATYPIGHGNHHRQWLSPHDLDTQSVKKNWIKHVFFISLAAVTHSKYSPSFYQTDRKIELYLKSLTPWQRFLETNSLYFMLAVHVGFMAYFGLMYWFYFMFLQVWYTRIYITMTTDVIPHVICKNNIDREIWWAWPLFLCNAYHITHHTAGYYLGPNKLSDYFNIQYYFIKLFYNVRVPRGKVPVRWTGSN
jgi:hypothetical protein